MASVPLEPLSPGERTHRVNQGKRMPVATGCLVGFGGYLLAAAVLSAVRLPHAIGLAVLLIVAACAGRRTTRLGALVVGALGWPFYAGFVTHTHGHLGIVGFSDAVVAVALVVVAVCAAAARPVVADVGPAA